MSIQNNDIYDRVCLQRSTKYLHIPQPQASYVLQQDNLSFWKYKHQHLRRFCEDW